MATEGKQAEIKTCCSELETCMYHAHQYMTAHSNPNQEDGAESSVYSYSTKEQSKMLRRKHTGAVPGCKKREHQCQHSVPKKKNYVQKERQKVLEEFSLMPLVAIADGLCYKIKVHCYFCTPTGLVFLD